ncbi:MAG: hypothetical protein Q9202_001431 [Teloschistes flavicans]
MPRYNPKSYNSRAYKPGHYSAYPRERRPAPRHIWRYTAAAGCLLLVFLFLTSSSRSAPTETAQPIDPFGRGLIEHRENDDEKPQWEEHEGWLLPFSDTITNNRSLAVLPPSHERPLIYTFYDAATERDDQVKMAERKLLRIWKRAWRAKGFKPVILGRAETVKNRLYEKFKVVENLDAKIWHEVLRWLAWEQVGAGALVDWLAVPMGSDDDDVLAFLRSGEFTTLTTYGGLGSGLLTGKKAAIRDALEAVLDSPNLSDSKPLLDILPSKILSTKPQPDFLAYYPSTALALYYEPISTALTVSKAAGLTSLAELITSHLHLTFLNTLSSIEVLTPVDSSCLILAEPALALAKTLTTCPLSPVPGSCPPNDTKCKPCSSSLPKSVKIAESYANESTIFTISAVPHPYTLASLLHPSDTLTVSHIRRTQIRDPWIRSATSKPPGPSLSGLYRVSDFKSTFAREADESHRSLWLPAEVEPAWAKDEIEQRLGFELPAYTPAQYNNARDTLALLASAQKEDVERQHLDTRQIKAQQDIFMRSRAALGLSSAAAGRQGVGRGYRGRGYGGREREKEVVDAAGAWHLADMEAWNFVTAMGERERKEVYEY